MGIPVFISHDASNNKCIFARSQSIRPGSHRMAIEDFIYLKCEWVRSLIALDMKIFHKNREHNAIYFELVTFNLKIL